LVSLGLEVGRYPAFLVRVLVRLAVMIPARGLTTVKAKVADPFRAPCVLSQTSYGCSN
jgi:hypothetical protein